MALLGPNTSGFLVPARGLTATFVPGAAAVPAGPVAVVAASGGVNHALAFLLAEAGHGVSLAVGLGNAVDVTAADVLAHLAEDPSTAAVALHVESVADGPALTARVRGSPRASRSWRSSSAATTSPSSPGRTPARWPRPGAPPGPRCGRPAPCSSTTSGSSWTRSPRCRCCGSRRRARASACVTAQAGPGLLHVDGLRGRGVAVPALTPATQAALGQLLPPLTYQANPVDTGRPGPEFADVLRRRGGRPGRRPGQRVRPARARRARPPGRRRRRGAAARWSSASAARAPR